METQLEKLIKSGRLESLCRTMSNTLERVDTHGRDNHARLVNVQDQLGEIVQLCAEHVRQKAEEEAAKQQEAMADGN
jgi:hypothetical protein